MAKRSPVGIAEIATLDNLARAFWLAARGKRTTPQVLAFSRRLEAELSRMQADLLEGRYVLGPWTSFPVFDPKPRTIHAPCFRDRVLHHAIMEIVGPVLDRALCDDTYACRKGRGLHAAVRRAQQHARRFPWYVKTDVRSYFASIDHGILRGLLRKKLKAPALLRLLDDLLDAYHVTPGRGLPIGALSSQHFANFYLAGLDRALLEERKVRGFVRYMDDAVWWEESRARARETLDWTRDWLHQRRGLSIRENVMIQRSRAGLPFLGFRVFPGTLKLSRRRRKRYSQLRAKRERDFVEGRIDALELQARYASVLAITAHADAAGWRRRELSRRASVDA